MTSIDPIRAIADSPALWFSTCARILTKDQQIVSLCEHHRPNEYQLKILRAYEWCMANGVPCRILALKPRQKGSSTVSAAIVYHHCRRTKARAVQIGDRYKTSDNLFAMTNRYAEHDDFPWNSEWDSTQNIAHIRLGGQEWSRIDKDTAENPRAGRSGTLQVLHVSEAAHFPTDGEKSADKTMLSMLNSLADVPESVAIVETTANGAAGWFYRHWAGDPSEGLAAAVSLDDFLAGKRGNGWIKIFSPWFEFEDSKLPVTTGQINDIKATLTERERYGITAYGWAWEQIAWRRWTMSQKCAGREDQFDQEYPETETGAFLSSGRPRFNLGSLSRLRQMSGAITPKVGFLHRQENETVTWEPNESGWAQIWEPPKEGCRYLLWCDTATGREQTKGSADPDRHSILVLRQGYVHANGETANHMLVARVRPPCTDDWHVLEEKVIALCLYYGKCLIGVEVPMGLTLLEFLRRAGMPLFKRKPLDPNSGTTEKLGFQTTAGTKPIIISSLSRALDGDPTPIDIYDPHAIEELSTFVIHEDGREAALNGKHDDDVMSLAMGIHHITGAKAYTGRPTRKRVPADLHRWKPLHR